MYLYKFRTMFMNLEKQKEPLSQYNLCNNQLLFMMKNDTCGKRVGKIMRKFIMDEIPQLLNALLQTSASLARALTFPKRYRPAQEATTCAWNAFLESWVYPRSAAETHLFYAGG